MTAPVASPRGSLLLEHPFEGAVGRKVTYEAPANLALVKYWGMRNEELTLPCAPSISMTLSACVSTTTVEVHQRAGRDEVLLAGEDGRLERAGASFAAPVRRHLDRLRAGVGIDGASGGHFTVATRNSFPSRCGLASSASGFAALTLAAVASLGGETSFEELSLLARASGSGSAARSVLGGWVVWPSPPNAPNGPAKQLFPPEHWDLRDVIAVVEPGAKEISSLAGHRRARSSGLFAARLGALPSRRAAVERAIAARDLARLGALVETDAAELQAIALSSEPPIVYPTTGTLAVLRRVAGLRDSGVPVYWSLDAGANVHLLCEPHHERTVADAVATLPEVLRVLRDRVGHGPRRLEKHLF